MQHVGFIAQADSFPNAMTTQTPAPTPALTSPDGVTLLKAFSHVTVKTYQLDSAGKVQVIPYGNEHAFTPFGRLADGIRGLAAIISELSARRDFVIIRGQPRYVSKGPISRNLENYHEPDEGLFWAMLDFDDIAVPIGVDPASIEAIEYVIGKLPSSFHNVSYFYQFSSSAGICQQDGAPLKSGLNVHLFFWFFRSISGPDLAAYLKAHCIATEFYELTTNRSGSPVIKYGIDFAMFRTVQPHYVATPIIHDGVRCTLDPKKRQGLIEKTSDAVNLPEIPDGLGLSVEKDHQGLLDEHKQQSGWVRNKSLTRARGCSVGIHSYFSNPAGVTTGKVFEEIKIKPRKRDDGSWVKYGTLFFVGEGSPGSWWISDRNPTIARRYGDFESLPLKELSPTAYAHVRDELGWFADIPMHQLDLTEAGFLPDIQSFATARNNLVLAPTGSGKTTAFCRFAMANRRKIIIYAAQTRALVRQMEDDLRAAEVPVVHYEDFSPVQILPAVYVTTNESLAKIVHGVMQQGSDYILVIDEAHIALDDFLRNRDKNVVFEKALVRAKKTFFMTATLTDVQLKKLTETIGIGTGELTPENFGYYQFAPVKQNPLWIAEIDHFWPDFTALLRRYKALKDDGQEIPRTIIIAATSKMEPFRLLLEHFELGDQAEVVSRRESFDEEIEDARIGVQPILISSPLFALGLNFQSLPSVFWTYFKDIQVDESQVIQTLNRANRDANPCEVRLYAGKLDPRPYFIPGEAQEKQKIKDFFMEESSFAGALDSHYQIDRLAYLQMREGEKNTGKALDRLIAGNSIQNYVIASEWSEYLEITEDDEKTADWAKSQAKENYDGDVLALLVDLDEDTQALLLHYLEKNYRASTDFRNVDKLKKEYDDMQMALSMALTKTADVDIGKAIEPRRISTLMGEAMVFISSQFDPYRYGDWMKVASEKTLQLVGLVENLVALKDGKIDGTEFGWEMRGKVTRQAILASATSEKSYVQLEKLLKKLDEFQEERRTKAGLARRNKIDTAVFVEARKYLATIGVYFKKDGKAYDPKQPVIPNWDLTAMSHRLLIKAISLKAMPRDPIDRVLEDEKWANGSVSNELCQQCAHCEPYFICALGRPIQPAWEGYEADTDKCDGFKKVPAKLKERVDLPAPS